MSYAEPLVTIRRVDVDDDDDLEVFTLGLAEQTDGSGSQLLLQRAYEFDNQDRELGQDTYAIIIGDDVAYGGIEEATFDDDYLTLVLSQAACKAFSLPKKVALKLSLDKRELELLKTALERLKITFQTE